MSYSWIIAHFIIIIFFSSVKQSFFKFESVFGAAKFQIPNLSNFKLRFCQISNHKHKKFYYFLKMALRAQFENSDDVGVFSKLTNTYCLVAIGGSEVFYR